jgi:aromatic-L-amino-acid/L-tryptophan decarboxylase
MSEDQTLDPKDWEAIRQTFHTAVDRCIEEMQQVRQRPVWQALPATLKENFREGLPHTGQTLDDLLYTFSESILPYGAGNTHPRFWGWVQGSGSMAGVFAEMLAAFMNCNLGGRDQVGLYVEQQVIAWCKEIFGFPDTASGILTSGTSIGTLIALTVARDTKAGVNIGEYGLSDTNKLVGYASAEAHSCIAKTFRLLGLGQNALRMIPVDEDYRMKPDQLAQSIKADRAAGVTPFAVIASAGTVNTGAFDNLESIHQICQAENLWMHVDAAFGGWAILAPAFKDRLNSISQADSVAFDFHKWLHVPYDAGCVLIRDGSAHHKTFSVRRDYLAGAEAGLAGGDLWYCDYGPELSRSFRALKIWFTLKAYGLDCLGMLITQNCKQATFLATLVTSCPDLELLALVSLNIVCFRFVAANLSADALDDLNRNIVIQLQVQGIAAPSTTRILGKIAIRVCITNHRTQQEDLELLIQEVIRLGKALHA